MAIFEGLNGVHSAKSQLLLGEPAEVPDWTAIMRTLGT